MKRIDRYIIRQFIGTLLFALLAFIILFIIIDLMEHLDDFLDSKVPEPVIVEYYIYFMPEIIKLVTPIAMLLACLFTTGRMSTSNEITVLKASGMSLYRFMLPFLIVAFLISAGSIYFNGWIVPHVNKKKIFIERVYLRWYGERYGRDNIYFQDSQTRIVSIETFDNQRNIAWKISIQDFSDTNATVLTSRYDSRQMNWDSTQHAWILFEGTYRTFTPAHESISSFGSLVFRSLRFTPEDVTKKIERPDEMGYREMGDFIQKQQESGNDVARWQVDFYSKISFPFASFIVVLFGVPFAATKRRSGLAVQFGISIGLCFVYLAFMKISQVFGYNGSLNPMLTAWLANIIFIAAAVMNIIRVRK
ncbi:MAG: LptF/LptG family permease [Bacteroidota bacterium]